MSHLFYHRTPDGAAILAGGFRDATGFYLMMMSEPITGVWISDVPLDGRSGAKGRDLLEINLGLSDQELAHYEVVEAGKGYREWCIPAAILSSHGTTRLLTEDEEDNLILPLCEVRELTSDRLGRVVVWQECEGPVNPPLHIPGKWYWMPCEMSEDPYAEEDPPYWTPCDTVEAAVEAIRRFEESIPVG